MSGFLKQEFSTQNIWFSYPKAEAFYLPQWQWRRSIYLFYRIVLAFYTVACLLDYVIAMTSNQDVTHNVMVYMTTWTYLLLLVHFNLAAINTIYCLWDEHMRTSSRIADTNQSVKPTSIRRLTLPFDFYGKKPDLDIYFQGKSEVDLEAGVRSEFNTNADRSTWYMKLSWLIFSVVFNWSIIVTLVFFGAIYPTLGEDVLKRGISFEDINIHGLNTALVISEVVISAYPVRFYHFLYSVLYGMIYMIFNITYWSYDPKNNVVYVDILDWNFPWSSLTLALVLAFVVTPVLQLIHLGLYKLRCLTYKKIYGHEYVCHLRNRSRKRVHSVIKTVSAGPSNSKNSNPYNKPIGGLPKDNSTTIVISTITPLPVEHLIT